MKLSERFDRNANGLNLIRLLLAVSVIFWHAFPITGRDIQFAPLRQFASEIGVDGFFAISGFLIYASWDKRPKLANYLTARALRIFPAFYVCLFLTPFVIAPIGLLLQGSPVATLFQGGQAFRYVGVNALLWPFQFGIAGTPAGVPYPEVWNGSMWTLAWEFLCYLAVPALGLVGLLKTRWGLTAMFLALVMGTLATQLAHVDSWLLVTGLRFALMFAAGMLVYRYRATLPIGPVPLIVAGAIVIGAMTLPDYRIVGAFFLAYALIALSSFAKQPRLRFRNDISYGMYIYAFPIQQVLAMAGLHTLNPAVFAVVATILTAPVALGSWMFVEKPALNLKRSLVARKSSGS